MEFDPQQLDEETEFVLDKFREGYTTLDVKIMIKNFVDSRVQQSFVQIQSLNYKNAYLIYKKIEKVLTISLRNFGKFADTLPFYKDIAIYILDTQINLKPGDKLTLLKTPIDLVQQSNSEINELYFFIIRNLIQALNNLGVIYVLRNKFNEAQQSFLRAIQSRSFLIENYLSIYQFSLLLKNLAFLFLQLQQNDDAAQFLNKGILGLEILSNPQLEIQEISINYKIMLNLIEIFYSKKDIKLLPEPREIQKERMVHLLALSYSYYGDLLEKLEKKQQAKFCKDQYQFLQDLFIKMYPRGLLKQQIETKKALEIDENIEIAKHQADQIKNKSIKDDTSNVTVKSAYTGVSSNPPDIKEDQIIFQKYMQIQKIKFKDNFRTRDIKLQFYNMKNLFRQQCILSHQMFQRRQRYYFLNWRFIKKLIILMLLMMNKTCKSSQNSIFFLIINKKKINQKALRKRGRTPYAGYKVHKDLIF